MLAWIRKLEKRSILSVLCVGPGLWGVMAIVADVAAVTGALALTLLIAFVGRPCSSPPPPPPQGRQAGRRAGGAHTNFLCNPYESQSKRLMYPGSNRGVACYIVRGVPDGG